MLTSFRTGWMATLAGLAVLFFSNVLGSKTDWIVWLGTSLFLGGLVLNLINTLIVFRLPYSKSPDLPELLILTFSADNSEFGSVDFRSHIQEFASRMEEAICDGKTSEYDGDEYGGGTGSLYFRATRAEELWKKINDAFPNNDLLRSCVPERVSEGGSRKKLRK